MNVRGSLAACLAAANTALLGLAALPSTAGAIAPLGRAAACTSSEGYSNALGDLQVGSSPRKWRFANSPYVGWRYYSCLTNPNVVTVHYGGVRGATHYNLRYATHPNAARDFSPYSRQIEIASPAPDRDRTFALGVNWVQQISPPTAAEPRGRNDLSGYMALTVQGCRRGGFLSRSTCTPWSPVVAGHFTRSP